MVRRSFALAFLACSSCQVLFDIDPDVNVIEPSAVEDAAADSATDASADVASCDPQKLLSDPYHCGACGHDCGGGACKDGVCQPLNLAKASGAIVDIGIDESYIYWTQESGSVHRVGKDGSGARSIASGVPGGVGRMAVDSTDVYFRAPTEPGAIFAINKATLDQRAIASDQPGEGALSSDGNNLFWATNTGDNVGGISRSSLLPDGGEQVVSLWSGRQFPREIAVDDNSVFWGENYQNILQGPKDGSAAPITLDCGVAFGAFVIDATALYWTTEEGDVFRMLKGDPASDCTAMSKRLLAKNEGNSPAFGIAINATQAFWSSPALGEISAVPKSGTCASPPCARKLVSAEHSPSRVVADDTAVYWFDAQDLSISKLVP